MVSSEAFIQEIQLCNSSPDVIDFESDTLKILCFQWHLRFDEFLFLVQADARVCTKRNALSVFLVDLFDPLRFLSRVAVVIKLIIKYLWAVGLDCDKVTPITVLNEWQYYQEELYEMSSFPIFCHVVMFIGSSLSLIGFADACGALVYVGICFPNKIIVVGTDIEFNLEHSCLLAKRNNFADLLIGQCHRTNLHTGEDMVTAILRQKYWIL